MPKSISVAYRSLLRLSFVGFVSVLISELVLAQAETQTDKRPVSLQQIFQSVDSKQLAQEARLRGDARRGSVVFHTSSAACIKCHQSGDGKSPLGPDLAQLGENITDEHLLESLLFPSKSIRQGFQTVQLLTTDGDLRSGMLVRENDETITLRDSSNLDAEITLAKRDIDDRSISSLSMMPEGLVSSLKSQREFLDLLCYLFDIQAGGPNRAQELMPSPEQLLVKDDTLNLNHAKIIREVENGKLKRGQQIYESSCVQCHGLDGNTPSLATARAFGKQKLKFGADRFSMFKTLSHGNGLMAATSALSPRERYEVVAYISKRFMKGSNPNYQEVTEEYLKSLPEGSDMGEFAPPPDRDYGPALASQLGAKVHSALTVNLGAMSVAYNLHNMDQAAIWSGGFLNLDQTQHKRGRGEGYPEIKGEPIESLSLWQWGHDGTLDYPREDLLPRGPLPNRWLQYYGHYLHDDKIVFSYAIDGRNILEVPSSVDDGKAIRRTLKVGSGKSLLVAVGKSDKLSVPPKIIGDIDGVTVKTDAQQRWVVQIPTDEKTRLIDIISFSESDNAVSAAAWTKLDPSELLVGGKLRWPDELETVGYRGLQTGAYAVDTITTPDSTPWNTWFRTSALDFFPDGRMVVATSGGDVWIASGINDDLLKVRWKRFAGGMYEPFGIKVVDGMIYVTCRDRLTRLHDINADGEADFYESFNADTDVTSFYHAFNFDLQTDSAGNFYYAKSGQYTDYKLPGAVIKVSADGKQREEVCTGLRTPNGMGILPDDRLTVSDNQGNWMPASKINLVRQGGFYGYVQDKKGKEWAPDGGKIDVKKVVPPTTFDQPLIWMPQEVDNSSGGQVFVQDERFGPLAGRLLHTSFGKGSLFYLMIQESAGQSQAALVKFPHDFGTGIMRGEVNPKDGQVYVTGMNGWNENGRPGLADGGIYRVRYTGKPVRMISNCEVHPKELRLVFNFAIDQAATSKLSSYDIEQWNYKWTGNYGSEAYHPETGEVGKQKVSVSGAKLSEDNRTLTLQIPNLQPVHQLRLKLSLKDEAGVPFVEEVYWTIHTTE